MTSEGELEGDATEQRYYVRLGTCFECPKPRPAYLQQEKKYETCFCHFPGDLLNCLFTGRQVCIFPVAWDHVGGEPADVPDTAACNLSLYAHALS